MKVKRNLIDVVAAAQKTKDAWQGRNFVEWKVDCVALLRDHAKNMGVKLKIPKYHDRASAAQAMKQLGFGTLAEALDAHFTRIEPHQILAGDLVEVPGENGFSAIFVALGNGRAIGFHQSIPHADILQPVLISGAWRIE